MVGFQPFGGMDGLEVDLQPCKPAAQTLQSGSWKRYCLTSSTVAGLATSAAEEGRAARTSLSFPSSSPLDTVTTLIAGSVAVPAGLIFVSIWAGFRRTKVRAAMAIWSTERKMRPRSEVPLVS